MKKFILGMLVLMAVSVLVVSVMVGAGAPPPKQCNDNVDNDGDGLIDFDGNGDPNLIDPGCESYEDDDETNIQEPECSVDTDCGDVSSSVVCEGDNLVETITTPMCIEGSCTEDSEDVITECEFGCESDSCLEGPVEIPVSIAIRPWFNPNYFYNNGRGVLPVAIFGSEDLDVTQIDVSSISLEGMSVRVSRRGKLLAFVRDIYRDGSEDLLVFIQDGESTLTEDSTTAVLTGTLLDGTEIIGEDSIHMVTRKFPGCGNW